MRLNKATVVGEWLPGAHLSRRYDGYRNQHSVVVGYGQVDEMIWYS